MKGVGQEIRSLLRDGLLGGVLVLDIGVEYLFISNQFSQFFFGLCR